MGVFEDSPHLPNTKTFFKTKIADILNDRKYGNRIFIVSFAKKINHLI